MHNKQDNEVELDPQRVEQLLKQDNKHIRRNEDETRKTGRRRRKET